MRRRSCYSPRTEIDARPLANASDSHAKDDEDGSNDHGASVISDVGTQCCVAHEDKAMNTIG